MHFVPTKDVRILKFLSSPQFADFDKGSAVSPRHKRDIGSASVCVRAE